VPPGLDGDLELGADAVGGRHQDGIAIAGRAQVEAGAEAADGAVGAGPGGGAGQRLDRLDQRVARVDIDAGILVAAAGYGVLDRLGLSGKRIFETRRQ
jgi:hypothetical protein